MLGGVEQRARERRGQRVAEQLAKREQLLNVVGGGEPRAPRLGADQLGRLQVAGAAEKPRNERDRRAVGVGGRRLGLGVAEKRRPVPGLGGGGARPQPRHQRQVPEDLALARAHRRIVEPVAGAPAAADGGRGARDLQRRGARPVEDQRVVLVPDLRVARHRLAVETEIVGIGGEERDRDQVLELRRLLGALVAGDPLPAVRAGDLADHGVVRVLRLQVVELVEPPRLRDPELRAVGQVREEMQERESASRAAAPARACGSRRARRRPGRRGAGRAAAGRRDTSPERARAASRTDETSPRVSTPSSGSVSSRRSPRANAGSSVASAMIRTPSSRAFGPGVP